MSRVYCTKCRRLQTQCLCSALCEIPNQVELVFLQHPLEQKQIKGTAWLTHACLKNSRFLVGETFTDQALSFLQDDKNTFLLYPAAQDESVETVTLEKVRQLYKLENCRVVILDGTWKKTRKMLYLNPYLAALPRIVLSPTQPSEYDIRKQKNDQSLSTLEACRVLLSELEQNEKRYQPLDKVLDAIQSQYRSFAEANLQEGST